MLLLTFPVVLTVVPLTGNVAAQSRDKCVATLELEVSYSEPFSYLSGIRELANGTILAADPVSQVVVRIDLDTGIADTLGREGAGPQEYDGPDRVFPLPGDSTLLVDLGNGRLIVIDPQGSFVDWTPMFKPSASGAARAQSIRPSFVDAEGNLYVGALYSSVFPRDSIAVHRIHRETGEEKWVVSLWQAKLVGRRPGSKRPILTLSDDFAVGRDGRVAVIRANGYSVDWYFPDGRVVHGPRNDVETFPVTLLDKEAEVERWTASSTTTYGEVGGGGTLSNVRYRRGVPASLRRDIDDFSWPETLPVFRVQGTLISPRGEAWVQRFMPAAGPGRVEVFDEQRIRVGFIDLPRQSSVIGFGARPDGESRVYLARTDEPGLIWLERYLVMRTGG